MVEESEEIMSEMMEVVLNVGDEVVFFEGRNNKPVAYWDGKVVLCKHKIPLGYAKVKSVEDKGRCFVVTADHIVKDVYSGIDYEDFLAVLPLHGFKIGFDRPFNHQRNDGSIAVEHQIFAYNEQNKCVIVAETFTWEWTTRIGFNAIDVYCPQLNVFRYNRCGLISNGSGNMTVFNLVQVNNHCGLLNWVNSQMEDIENPHWPEKEYPSLWNYEDSNDCYDENGEWNLGKKNLKKLLDAPKEALLVFSGCNWLNELVNEKIA